MNLPDAIWRSALTCSAAERDTGTIYLAAWARDIPRRCAFRQHSLISAPVQPSSSGNSPATPYFLR